MEFEPPDAPPPPPPPAPFGVTAPSPMFLPPAATNSQQFQAAYHARASTDYLFDFWTQLGWTVLTCGFYSVYVMYQQIRRSRDHNRRRIELLQSTTNLCWERAQAEGSAESLRPNFERIAQSSAELRRVDGEFRDPGIWALLAFLGGSITAAVAFILLDKDLLAHDRAEGAIEHELALIFAHFGIPLIAPEPSRLKGEHNYGGRIAAAIGSCGIYMLWWTYDSMTDLNRHFEHNWRHDDALAAAVAQLGAAA